MTKRRQGEATLRALLRAGLLDPTRKTRAQGDEVVLPVRPASDLPAWAERLDARLIEEADPTPRDPRRSPREQVTAILEPLLPSALLASVPDKWEQLGDVLVLRLPDALRPHASDVAAAFADVLAVKSVLDDREGVAGEYREMRAAPLWGSDTIATHVENGVTFRFDASRIMFSSGNVAERARAAALPAKGETVVDMFAGVGYFAIPLAVHARPARVVAIEKSPLAYRYLVENAERNGVADIVECWHGDNREYQPEGIADRVLMGYFPGTSAFLPKALRLLKPEGGVIHYHDTAHERTWREELTRAALDAARGCGVAVRIADARVVKSHSPGVVHAVLELHVRR